ncbi:response regulator transcription factor [Acuticoccus sp. MNP-M23]|uniref:response regulator transcription factor n=1 Tax=Acuticoccus sp. MNP-M23 TaxID=3072793 RepID=UPI002814A632|nr:response regulator transcription factor [Acuticoccus sp. MNP-M23]WMS42975.1 response regulator transcription factor [Acuticoccus sp. MNP-M23]
MTAATDFGAAPVPPAQGLSDEAGTLEAPKISDQWIALVVDDDEGVRELVTDVLQMEGYAVRTASNLADARRALSREEIVICIVDLNLTSENGIDLVKELSGSQRTAVIILSGRGDVFDVVIGIEIGADDYISKPFHTRELSARVKRAGARIMQLREQVHPVAADGPVAFGEFSIDPRRYSVTHTSGQNVALSKPEIRLLAALVTNSGNVLSRDTLHHMVIGPGERNPMDRRIDIYVSSIRKKLASFCNGAEVIRTVHRVGYIID